jgi:SAM-dependent methyltransferase
LIEFTGERVVPGQIDPDLWNEHLARYQFASRLVEGRRVLDAGCGSGYGSARLAASAAFVLGIDSSAEAVDYARTNYASPKAAFSRASGAALPLAGGSIDVVVAFELIEHLADWRAFLEEARRVLAPGGLLVISTPNREYYAESRQLTGPNPFHVHEFDLPELAAALSALFPHVSLYLENHVAAIAFQPLDTTGGRRVEIEQAARGTDPASAHFFLAVCGASAVPEPRTFVYVPTTANVLRERELHIEKAEADVARLRQEKQEVVEMFRAQKAELERSNLWAEELDEKLAAAQARIVELQQELAQTTAGYQARVADLEAEDRRKTEWAGQLEAELEAKGQELLKTIALLDAAEDTVRERTAWAQRLDAEVRDLRTQLDLVRASRWVKLGKRFGLGPQLPDA